MKSSALKSLSRLWERMMRYASRGARQLALSAFVSCALAGGLGYLAYGQFVSPQSDQNDTDAAALAKIEAENATNREIERTDPQFRAEIAKIVNLYDLARPMLPTSAEVGGVLAQVQTEATKNGVTLQGLTGNRPEAKSPSWDKLYQREYPATATGTHAQVIRFFYAVSRLERIVLVPNFTETSLRQRVSVSFPILAYNAPPTQEIPRLAEGFGQTAQVPPPSAATPPNQQTKEQ